MFEELYQRNAQGAGTYYSADAYIGDKLKTGIQTDQWQRFKPFLEVAFAGKYTKIEVLSVGMKTISGTYYRESDEWIFIEEDLE